MLLAALAVALLGGCAKQVISRESLLLADRSIAFGQLRESPDRFVGKHLIVGGIIAAVRNGAAGGELEIAQLPLDSNDRPDADRPSEGRFLALGSAFLDPVFYQPGLLVTLVGKVGRTVTLPLDGRDYTYPVFEIRELYLWRPEDPYRTPPVQFGIGIGIGL